MNLYKISQKKNTGFSTYSDAIVAAPDVKTAKRIHPGYNRVWKKGQWRWATTNQPADPPDEYVDWGGWAPHIKYVKVTLIGTAVEGTKTGVLCFSYHAG